MVNPAPELGMGRRLHSISHCLGILGLYSEHTCNIHRTIASPVTPENCHGSSLGKQGKMPSVRISKAERNAPGRI